MAESEEAGFLQSGREIGVQEIEHIREVSRGFPALSRKELAQTICEHWGWVTASGAHKVTACLKLLEKLEESGQIRLGGKRGGGPYRKKGPPVRTERSDPRDKIGSELGQLGRVSLEVVTNKEATGLWNEYVERYHYLGYKKPFGCVLRYFIVSKERPLGCLLMAGAAKSLGARDRWIGWSERQRLRNLPWLICNSRYLIFPWVQVKHMASHVLGQLARRVRADWEGRWGYHPVLMETFVDPARYPGTCYRAAGWIHLGQTTGAGLVRPGREYTTTRKMIYVKPLVRDFREQLCSDGLTGRVIE
ncbi:MAG TPA: Druantia anti-phage system protein DruA [Methylomirabilota bacterium]|nr:Druantia anti-phage system protein DruA [Methylomirabilota bacterium]